MQQEKVVDILFEEIDSTQTHAKAKYEELYQNQITFLRALHQTAGRGQADRKWESESKKNILTTLIYPYFTNFQYLRNISLVIGWSIIQIYKELYNFQAQIKWVNDIIINNKKAGGILTEIESIGNQIVLYIGIGLNVDWCYQGATSIEVELNKEIDQEILFIKLKEVVLQNLKKLNDSGFEQFRSLINDVLFKKGEECEFIDAKTLETVQIAKVEEINKDGDLISRGQDGLSRIILPNLRMKL